MATKSTGLKGFGSRPSDQGGQLWKADTPASDAVPTPRKARGQQETVALTVRLKRADWMRLHQLALAEGTSLQSLCEKGLSRTLSDLGLPPLTS